MKNLLGQNVRSKESSYKNLEKKIMFSSLIKSCDELPKIIENKEEWQPNKIEKQTKNKLVFLYNCWN